MHAHGEPAGLLMKDFAMFFVIIFLILAALASYFFPSWSWGAILVFSLGSVAALRLFLHFLDRPGKTSDKNR